MGGCGYMGMGIWYIEINIHKIYIHRRDYTIKMSEKSDFLEKPLYLLIIPFLSQIMENSLKSLSSKKNNYLFK